MAIVVLMLLGSGLAILFKNIKNEVSVWAAFVVLSAGFGVFAVYIHDNAIGGLNSLNIIIPYELLKLSEYICSSIMHYFAPYAFLMHSICNLKHDNYFYKNRRILSLVLIAPIFLMYLFFPIYNGFYPNYNILALWASPYIVMGSVLLFYSYRSYNSYMEIKRQKLLYCIIFIPTMLFSLITNYWSTFLRLQDTWRYGILLLLVQVCLLVFFMIKYGFAGVKLRLEQHQTEKRINAVTIGANSLIHAMKNYASLSKYKIEFLIEDINKNDISSNTISSCLQEMLGKTNYIISLANELNLKMTNKPIVKECCKFSDVITKSINFISLTIDAEKFEIQKECPDYDIEIFCDKNQLVEVLINLLRNSLEAMKNGGLIEVKYYYDRRNIYISVKDNGEGITKENIGKVTDPFFSTKGGNNFGVGLSYCYNVIKQHKGSMTFESKVNEGTVVNIVLPLKHLKSA